MGWACLGHPVGYRPRWQLAPAYFHFQGPHSSFFPLWLKSFTCPDGLLTSNIACFTKRSSANQAHHPLVGR
ncbi:hypothetical protein F0562_026697 [Nyssa sinensis]|uniref:Uncharacterized protein n=1 Tax=Nyssa sinensis TaxID=561372 RepID=A0A5J5B9Y7_9ASTE|nr:hypothetical protein F0562_026697 [Nyssa sinensis]